MISRLLRVTGLLLLSAVLAVVCVMTPPPVFLILTAMLAVAFMLVFSLPVRQRKKG